MTNAPKAPWSGERYWSQRFLLNDSPWELGKPSGVVLEAVSLLSARDVSLAGSSVLVPGCGTGSDALALARAGAHVLAVDWSPVAVERLGEKLGAAGPLAGTLEVRRCDVLTADLGVFDIVVEHTFLCAIDPSQMPQYAKAVSAACRPGGHLVGNLFLLGESDLSGAPWRSLTKEGVGPPFGSSERTIRELLGGTFEFLELKPARSPDPDRRPGIEWAAVLRRRELG